MLPSMSFFFLHRIFFDEIPFHQGGFLYIIFSETRFLPLVDTSNTAECDMIDLDKIEQMIDDKTKVICVGLASNVTGRTHLEAVKKIVEITANMKTKPFLILDGTHFVPHCLSDLTALGADAIISSAYKYFGPHLGVMAYNRDRFSQLSPVKVRENIMKNTHKHCSSCSKVLNMNIYLF